MEIGIDIIEVRRVTDGLAKYGTRFATIFMNEEEICDNMSPQHIAGVWAAKEAIVKATSITNLLDISIVYLSNGKPKAICKEHDVKISISHEREYAVGMAIKE